MSPVLSAKDDDHARTPERYERHYLVWRCAACGDEHTAYLGNQDIKGSVIAAEQKIINGTYVDIASAPVSVETEFRYRLLPDGGMLNLSGCVEVASGTAPVLTPPRFSERPVSLTYSALQEAIEAVVLDPDERAALYRELGLL